MKYKLFSFLHNLLFMSLLRRLFSTKNTSPVEELETLYKLFKSVNSTSSNLQKYEALVKHPTCHSILKRIYDPHLRHYVTAKTAKKYIETHPSTPSKSSFQSLNELLDALSSRTLSGNAANEAVGSFYKAYCKTPPIQQLFWKVLDRNLKMGVSVQTIRQLLTSNGSVEINSPVNSNKKGTAQNHFISVALATTLPSKKDIFDFSKDTWYVSQKLDGIRCIAMLRYDDKRQKHDISFYSRTGRPFTSLQKVQKNIEKRLEELKIKSDFALDGEICAYSNDNTTNEDFIAALKQVRRINVEMENPVFQVFDLVPLDQFLTGKGATTFKQRQTALKEFIGSNQLPHLKIVEQQLLTSYEQLENMKISAIQLGWEGLIVRKDTPYEGKRT